MQNLLEGHKFGSVLNVADGETLLTQLIHHLVVLWMIGGEHQQRVVTHLTEILKSLGRTKVKEYCSVRQTDKQTDRQTDAAQNWSAVKTRGAFHLAIPEQSIMSFRRSLRTLSLHNNNSS